MPTKAAILRSAINTSSGNQTFTTTDLGGLTPKAVIVIVARTTSDGSQTADVGLSVGYATGANSERVTSYASEDNVSGSEAYRRQSDALTVNLCDGNDTSLAVAEFVSFTTNGFTLNWTSAPSAAYLLTAILFAGDEVTAAVGNFLPDTTQDNYVDVSLAFNADLIFLMSSNGTATSEAHAYASHGVAVEGTSVANYGLLHYQQDNASTTSNYAGGANNRCVLEATAGLEVTDISASGFRVYTRDDNLAASKYVHYLALSFSDVNVWAGIVNPATTTGTEDYTGPNFEPQLWLFEMNFGDTINTYWDGGTSNGGSFGISAIDANEAYVNYTKDRDNQSTTDGHTYSDNTAIAIECPYPSNGSYIASFDSFLSTGLRVNFSAVTSSGAGDHDWIAIAIEKGLDITTVEDDITADAVVRVTEDGSITANAVALRVRSGTVTANGVIFKTTQASVTANAVAKRLGLQDDITADAMIALTTEDTLSASAVITVTEEPTITADALIKLLIQETLLADAAVLQESQGTVSAYAAVLKVGDQYDITANAVALRVEGDSFDADSAIKQETQDDITADAYIDSNVELIEGDFTGDAAIFVAGTQGSIGSDAVVHVPRSGSITANAVKLQVRDASFLSQAVVRGVKQDDVLASAVVSVGVEDSILADAVAKATTEDNIKGDALVVSQTSDGITADATVFSILQHTLAADAFVWSGGSIMGSLPANGIVRRVVEGTITSDAYFFRVYQTFVYGNAVVSKYGLQGSITANAVARLTHQPELTADAFIVYTIGKSFTAAGTVFKTISPTFTANAFVIAPGTRIFTAQSAIKKATQGSIAADAEIVVVTTNQASITANAVTRKVQAKNLSGNAVVKSVPTWTLLADAIIKSEVTLVSGSITSRAWIVNTEHPEPRPLFLVEDTRPPNPRGDPKGGGYWFKMPEPSGLDGYGRKVGAVGRPWIEIYFEFCDEEVFDWYNSWVPEGEAYGVIDSVQCWNPWAIGGGQWVLFEGDDIYLWRPTVEGHLWGYYNGVRIYITNLS